MVSKFHLEFDDETMELKIGLKGSFVDLVQLLDRAQELDSEVNNMISISYESSQQVKGKREVVVLEVA